VFAKSMNEPIDDCRELSEGEKRDRKFFVSGAEAPVALDSAEEVFDFMAPPVVAAMKGHWPTARALRGDADPRTLPAQARAKRVGIEAFVGNCATVAQAGQERLDRVKIVTLALGQAERDGSTTSLNDRGKLGINSTLCATDRLGGLTAARVCTVLMQFKVRAIDMP
jgi:hypothetical protein